MPLFTSPSSDAAREVFAAKPRALVEKVMSVTEAVTRASYRANARERELE